MGGSTACYIMHLIFKDEHKTLTMLRSSYSSYLHIDMYSLDPALQINGLLCLSSSKSYIRHWQCFSPLIQLPTYRHTYSLDPALPCKDYHDGSSVYLFIYVFIHVNICCVPHLKMSPKHLTMTTLALFSSSKQIHCALVVCSFEWVTVASRSVFWISVKVVTALF